MKRANQTKDLRGPDTGAFGYVRMHRALLQAATPWFHQPALAGRVRAAAILEARARLGNPGRFRQPT